MEANPRKTTFGFDLSGGLRNPGSRNRYSTEVKTLYEKLE